MNATLRPVPSRAWQREMATSYTYPAELLRDLGLDPGPAAHAAPAFPLRVPRAFAARMRHGDPRDPLLLQVLPRPAEAESVPGFVDDPVGDLASVRQPGLLQKYAGRALLITSGACAVNCRYCFRRTFPYGEQLGGGKLVAVLDAIRRDRQITEVILSGGDPLSLSDRRLGALLDGLDGIPHLRRIRLHTRTPIVLPARVDRGLETVLTRVRKPLVTVLHCNHAQEIDAAVAAAARCLRRYSTALLNQAVLLRDVNDSVDAQVDLAEALFAIGVLPYYLHQLDPVAGAAHFAVPDETARACLRGMARRLPGYLVPRLVREVAGAESKLPL